MNIIWNHDTFHHPPRTTESTFPNLMKIVIFIFGTFQPDETARLNIMFSKEPIYEIILHVISNIIVKAMKLCVKRRVKEKKPIRGKA